MPISRVVNLTDHWYPDKIGGSCIYAYKLHQLLSPHVRTETVTLVGDRSPRERRMVVHKVLRKASIWKNRQALRAVGHDANTLWIVHSPWFFLQLFAAYGFSVRNQVVAVYHGPWFREYFLSAAAKKNYLAKLVFTLPRYLIEFLYSIYVTRFIFLSATMHRATAQYLPIPRRKVTIIPMWSERNAWLVPKPANAPLILSTFRRLEPRMGLQDFFRALPDSDLTDYRLFVCGDGPYRDQLVELIRSLNLQDKVKFMGWVSEEEKCELIRKSDAVIIPSKALEGFSLLALEALERGTPVVVTQTVGFYEYVRHLDQQLVKCIDLSERHMAINEFLSMGAERKGMDELQAIFAAERISQALLRVVASSWQESGGPTVTSWPIRGSESQDGRNRPPQSTSIGWPVAPSRTRSDLSEPSRMG